MIPDGFLRGVRAAVFDLDDNAKVHKEWFGHTVINSDHRLDYEQGFGHEHGLQKGFAFRAGVSYSKFISRIAT